MENKKLKKEKCTGIMDLEEGKVAGHLPTTLDKKDSICIFCAGYVPVKHRSQQEEAMTTDQKNYEQMVKLYGQAIQESGELVYAVKDLLLTIDFNGGARGMDSRTVTAIEKLRVLVGEKGGK